MSSHHDHERDHERAYERRPRDRAYDYDDRAHSRSPLPAVPHPDAVAEVEAIHYSDDEVDSSDGVLVEHEHEHGQTRGLGHGHGHGERVERVEYRLAPRVLPGGYEHTDEEEEEEEEDEDDGGQRQVVTIRSVAAGSGDGGVRLSAGHGSGQRRRYKRHEQEFVVRHPEPGRFDPSNPIKRLIAACDGTWLNSDSGQLNGQLQIESNVTRIGRAILPETHDGIQQIVFYAKGVGSTGSPLDRVVTGAVGEGLNQAVREAYSFIANNYAPGDEIILVGFSRGAFTARQVAGLIDTVGILTKRGLSYLPEVYKDVLHRRDKRYRPRLPDVPFPNKPSAMDPAYREELFRRGLTVLDVKVKAVGVWDTVGSLGLPRVGILQNLGLQHREAPEMMFYDTKLPRVVENAFQALALDERRTSFAPAVWEMPEGSTTRLRQVWFPGVHSNCGGGYEDQELANITLAWMMSMLSPFLEFYDGYIITQEQQHQHAPSSSSNSSSSSSRRRRRGKPHRPRPWSFGKIINSLRGVYNFGGGSARTPGRYHVADPIDGEADASKRLLRNTHEYVHPSVRTRFALRGPGVDDAGDYDPEALDGWRLVVEYPRGGDREAPPEVYWRAVDQVRGGGVRELPESPVWDVERLLLGLDPGMEDEVLWPPPTRKRRPHG